MSTNVDVPEADLFEQSQFSAAKAASPENADSNTNTALRGTRYKNSFIPPKPVGGPQSFHSYSMSNDAQHQSQAIDPSQGYAATPAGYAQSESPQHIKSQGLVLNPPKLPNPATKTKSPSLFERISGTVQQGIEGLTGGGSYQERQRFEPAASNTEVSDQKNAPMVTEPSQRSLNIDSPSAPKRSDDDLDIPAFLRRQAN